MSKLSTSEFSNIIESCWCAKTSFVPEEWNKSNPSRGQCVVTALVIQDYFGGELLKYRTVYNGKIEKHYCNRLPDGSIVDITREQYPNDIELEIDEIDLKGFSSLREKRLADPDTKSRYELLRSIIAT